MLEEAKAYKKEVVARAEGDAQRFISLYKEYRKAPAVTRDRIYIETVETVLSQSSKIMVDVKGGNNMIYLPLDKTGADLLFQIISHRYEKGSIILTTNRAFKHWPEIFNNDSTITSAVLDRLLHHAETVVIEGQSYRMKDRIEP